MYVCIYMSQHFASPSPPPRPPFSSLPFSLSLIRGQDRKAEGDAGCRQSELARARHEAHDPSSRCNPIERYFQQRPSSCGPISKQQPLRKKFARSREHVATCLRGRSACSVDFQAPATKTSKRITSRQRGPRSKLLQGIQKQKKTKFKKRITSRPREPRSKLLQGIISTLCSLCGDFKQ